MQTRRLGNSDLHITPLGIGAWAMGGGGWAFAWGPQDDHDSIAAIHAAVDRGLNWIDTAAVYGLGHSEEVVGRALQGRSKRPYVFTKCELVWNEQGEITQCLKAESLRRECEASLRRLQTAAIDLYQVHWPLPDPDIEEGWDTLARLQQEGKVRWIGVSNFSVAQLERVRPIAPVTSLQPPYSLLFRGIEAEALPYARQHNIGVLAYSPMKHGLLSGAMTRERIAALPEDDHRRRRPEFREPALTRILELVEKLREVGQRHGRTPGEVAIAWVLRHPAITGAIVGLRNPQQLEGVIGAADLQLSAGEVAEIESLLS
jgi:aryl-alcohol dehydrogenase-like predicted oxidoreductase